jgi:hypothetical protein
MRRLALACAVALTCVAFATTAASAHNSDFVFPAKAHPYGHSYTFWAKDWTQWALGTPVPSNPFLDPDKCGPHVSPRVWYLAGSFDGTVTAHCTMPEHKALLISPAGNFCSEATHGVSSAKQLTECALSGVADINSVRVTVDGRRVARINRFFLISPKYGLHLQADNLFGVPAQTTPAVVVGDFVMIRPLNEGKHTIVGFVKSETGFPSGFAKIVYHVHVTD